MVDKVDIWMPLYIGQYLAKTMHLTTEQHGAYMLIIMAYWQNNGPLCESRLPAIAKLSPDAWSIAQALLAEFFDTKSKPGFWVHHKIEKELKRATKNRETNKQRAKTAANKRWANTDDDSF